jgi:outer membrane immunogenic protein
LCVAAALAASLTATGGAFAGGGFASLKDGPVCRHVFRGFYVGSSVGFGLYQSNQGDLDGYLADNAGYTASHWRVVGGPQVGYSFQQGCQLLVGVEADWSGAGFHATTRLNTNVPLTGFDQRITSELGSFGTIRLRTGFVIENTLFYLTGGLAIAGIDTRITNIIPGVIDERFSISATRRGWATGAGVEWSLGGSVSLKSEVLYLALGEASNTVSSPTLGNTFTFKSDDSAWVSRIGLNFRFGN